MEARLLGAALWRRRGTAGLAALAIAIGVSVASALLHVSRGVSDQLRHDLRALGPNLLVLPAEDGGRFLDAARARAALAAAGLVASSELLVVARSDAGTIPIVGADFSAAATLHPQWRLGDSPATTRLGARLAKRLGLAAGDTLRVVLGDRALALPAGPVLEAGGPEDDAWWVPIEAAQRLAGLTGRASVVEARVEGERETIAPLVARIAAASGARVVPLSALSDTEGQLLARMRRLMLLVTAAALAAAGLCAFGTLMDLALERRREIALLRALGAAPRDVVRLLGAEAAAIGLLGGLAGWAIGLFFSGLIGRQVFHSVIGPRWDVVPVVLGMALAVAGLASIVPIRSALATDPATALKGD